MRIPQHDFNYRILGETAHRPWPMPRSPWVMTQTWHDLLFAHWPVDARVLRERVPRAFPIDLFEGQAWLGIVPFVMTNVAPRLAPALPGLSRFPELNVRTYVRVGDRPGVFFFSLDAASRLAVWVARALLHLPYFRATMRVRRRNGWVEYSSRRGAWRGPGAHLQARYRPVGNARPAAPGTLDYFLTERYCLYALRRSGRPYRLEIHHPPWPLQAAEAEFSANSMAEAAGIPLPAAAPLLHFARRQDMVAWPPQHTGLKPCATTEA